MKKAFRSAALFDVALYAVQFLIVPLFYENVLGRSNEAWAILVVTTALFTSIGMFAFSDKPLPWLLGFVLYIGLIALYAPPRAYGIGLTGFDLDGLQSRYSPSDRFFGIAVVGTLVLLLQSAAWIFTKSVRFIYKILRGKRPRF
jgi:hypothetical protein